ncbi:hypothetical protein [Corallococcus terminator]|uniref:Uncharacterized protein n=1 Tax=Corallococcus terminator TaxID=2316733 RepID=A0A3A8IPG5_9BACT|nr:hypothetical protein [Corallococcus terminator]RKG85349.1 hypothetical protein D7V88_20015 [Corallococcus terminator]
MPTPSWSRLLCLPLLSLGFSGCGESGVHTRLVFALKPSLLAGDAALASGVRAMESPPSLPNITSDDGLSFQLEGASATLADIRLELGSGDSCSDVRDSLPAGTDCVEDGGQATVILAGPVSVNLATGEMTPPLEIPPSSYRRVAFQLAGNGFKAHTRYFQESKAWNMDLTLPAGEVLRFDAPTDVVVKEAGSLRVVFQQDTWIQGLPLASCFQKGDLARADASEILLDEARGECQGAGEHVRDNLRVHGTMSPHSF